MIDKYLILESLAGHVATESGLDLDSCFGHWRVVEINIHLFLVVTTSLMWINSKLNSTIIYVTPVTQQQHRHDIIESD